MKKNINYKDKGIKWTQMKYWFDQTKTPHKVMCQTCKRILSIKYCIQWTAGWNWGDGHYDCFPCIESRSILIRFEIKNGYHPLSVYSILTKKKIEKDKIKKCLKEYDSTWNKLNGKYKLSN